MLNFHILRESRPNIGLFVAVLSSILIHSFASDVIVFTDANFDRQIKTYDLILVEFYAPWCQHCKKLAPEYEAAASRLKKNVPPIPLAKIDCSANKKTCENQGAAGYPTLKIYRKGVGAPVEGLRDSDSIVRTLRRQVGPSSLELKNEADYEEFIDNDEHSVVGFFETESKLKDSFLKVADTERDRYRFAHTSDKKLLDKFDLNDDIVIVQPKAWKSKFEDSQLRYDGNYDTEKIKRFLGTKMNGLCGVRTLENSYTFDKPLVIVYFKVDFGKDPKGTNYYRNRVLKVAKEFRRKIHFAISNKDDFYNELKEYGLEAEYDKRLDTPMVAAQGVYGEKYRMDDEFSVENLKRFAEDLLAGKLINYMKSEPVPARNNGPVKILVANNFKDFVDGKDALIEIYAPWCGHCKAMEPTYYKLGQKMEDEDVVIAKIDGTANDLPPGYSSQGFPTIYFKPKNGPPMLYQHGRELDNFINFLAHVATDELKGWTREGKKRKNLKKEL